MYIPVYGLREEGEMILADLSIQPLHIPFRVAFQHASAERNTTEAVIVKAVTKYGIESMGEGCPRPYVTAETVQSSIAFFQRHRSELLKVSCLADLKNWISRNAREIDSNPAGYCAVELALLDALAKSENTSVEALLGLPEISGEFRYTGVLGAKNPQVFQGILKKYKEIGMTDYKIKLFGEPEVDEKNLSHFQSQSDSKTRVRFDANNLWQKPDEAVRYINSLNTSYCGLEEPLQVKDYAGLQRIAYELQTPIILDESFIRLSDFEHIKGDPERWMINIRVSKMGGLLRSLEIVQQCRNLSIPFVVGAQVGETSILTRAAITLANTCKEFVYAQEGAFGTFLLEYDLLDPPVMFGPDGVVQADQLRQSPDTH